MSKVEISVTLPSLRPEALRQRIKEFAATSRGCPYELVVVSPFPVKGERVVSVLETKREGVVRGHINAYENASGEYIVYWADDLSPGMDCLPNMLRYVKSKKSPFIGSFRYHSRRGLTAAQSTVYGKLYANYGCLSRETIRMIGGYFDPVYRAGYLDLDIGLRTWVQGGRVEVCPDAWIYPSQIDDTIHQENKRLYAEQDFEFFSRRWHDILGKGMERKLSVIHKEVPIKFPYNLEYAIYDRLVPEKLKKWIRERDVRFLKKISRGKDHDK